MTPLLLDASCVLAWLFDEPGADRVDAVLTSSYITAVNMVEVVTKVERVSGVGLEVAGDLVEAGLTVVPVGWVEIPSIGEVRRRQVASSAQLGLALGDVTCLGYALAHDMKVWTADRAWLDLDLPVEVTSIC